MLEKEFSDRLIIILLIVILAMIYLPFILSNYFQGHPYLKGDMCYHEFFIQSVLQDHDWYIADNVGNRNPLGDSYPFVALDKNNRLVPIHSLLFPLSTIPLYLLFNSMGLLIFNVLCVMGIMVLIYLLNRLFFNKSISLITTFLFATGTLFFDYTYNYSPDVFSTLLVIAALLALLKRKTIISLFLLGLSVWAKLSNLIFFPFFLCYLVITVYQGYPKKYLFASLAAFLIPILIIGFLNFSIFGSPFTTGYDRMVIKGYKMIDSDFKYRFGQPLLTGVFLQLFDKRNGLIPTCPILLFVIPGLFCFKRCRQKKEFILILLLALSQFFLYSKDIHWNRSHFSNRYLMTTVALSSVFVSNFIKWGVFNKISRFLKS